MKKIFKLFFLLIATASFGQATLVPIENRKTTVEVAGQTYYYKDVNGVFTKFIGNWRYQDSQLNPSKIVEISFLKRGPLLSGMGYYYDEIYALIKYTHNGVVVYDTYPIDTPTIMTRDYNVFGGYFKEPTNTNKLNLYYSEPGLGGKRGYLSLEYDYNGENPILNWKVRSFRDPSNHFKIPNDMVLEKELM